MGAGEVVVEAGGGGDTGVTAVVLAQVLLQEAAHFEAQRLFLLAESQVHRGLLIVRPGAQGAGRALPGMLPGAASVDYGGGNVGAGLAPAASTEGASARHW